MSNPIKPTAKTEFVPISLLLITLGVSLYFYANFPEKVPTHWNIEGEVDGYSSKALAAFFFPVFNILMYLFILVLPSLDPKKDRYEQFSKVYHVVKATMIAFLTVIYFYLGINGLGYQIHMNYVIPPLISILLIIFGNYMAKIKPNWFIGIRTPWTLSSEEVWNKTHRLGGKIFIVLGMILVFGVFLHNSRFYMYALLAGVLIASLALTVYSYLLHRNLREKENEKSG